MKNKTNFYIDLAIVRKDSYGWHRLIHQKTGYTPWDRWYWNLSPNSASLEKKITWLKENNLWMKVREVYLRKKNIYLSRRDQDHPSFIVYIETINEVYAKHFNKKEK